MTPGRWRTLALVLAVALGVALVGWAEARSGDEGSSKADRALALAAAEKGATAAARKAAVNLTTYDFSSIDADFAWIDDSGTEKFKAEYAKVSAPIKKAVAELKVHAEGSVDEAAATAKDADHVTVLLFVDQTLLSGTSTERQLATPRITMTMVREDGRWLVDDVAVRNLAGS
ncbi:Mce-associated membrane protein [Marmoricola sp. OAE513]|uniref:hypothetical protein n=1 Tax=Marmoricola sp. OAE513 TaxID=2817894 RepID=UPI001AE82CA8